MPNKASSEIPSYSQRAKDAGLPLVVSREFIAELGTVTWISVHNGEARNPQTGNMDPVLIADLTADDGENYRTVVGNVALSDVLSKVEFPFRARIVKSGRTWVFAD